METIELKPTREGYMNMLSLIIESSTNAEDVVWAAEEYAKFAGGGSKRESYGNSQYLVTRDEYGVVDRVINPRTGRVLVSTSRPSRYFISKSKL